jgi:enterochelin esterase family protein
MPTDLTRLLQLTGTLHLDTIESRALAGNPLGDPAARLLPVYVPPGYDPEGSVRYPVLYALHGYLSNAAALVGTRPWESNVVQRLDRLIAAGTCAPAILAIVDGFTRLGGSQYVDSVHNGAYATYAARDAVAHVDARYRTVAREGGRAVFGKSSGGFGALHLVLTHPGVFAAVASHSGDMYFRYSLAATFAPAQRMLERYGGIARFVTAFEGMRRKGAPELDALLTLAMAAAYSPAAPHAFALDLPFDPGTGAAREDVLARWLAYDPVELVPERTAELRRLRLRYLDCGRRDEYSLDVGARIFARRARECGLDVRYEEFDEGHRDTGYRQEISLPALSEVLDRS